MGTQGFPSGLEVNILPVNGADSRDASSTPGSGRSPGGGSGSPLQHSCLENPMEFLTQSQSPPQEFYIQSPPQLVNLSLSELRKLPLLIPGLLSIKWEGPADLPPGEVIWSVCSSMTESGKLFPSRVACHLICTEPLHLSSPFPIVLPFKGSLVTPLLDFLHSNYLHSYSLRFFFEKIFFDMGHLKVFIEFVTILFLFYVWVFLAVRHAGS